MNKIIRVTFDTNVCNVVHNPEKWPSLVAPDDARKIRAAVSDTKIAGFVSEATLFVECLSFPDKLIYLSVAGTPDPRPAPDPQLVAMFEDLASIGMKVLHAPLIGAEKFVEGLMWAEDDAIPIKERQARFSDFIQSLPRHAPLRSYGQSLLAHQPPVPRRGATRTGPNSVSFSLQQDWAVAIKREWDDPATRKSVEKTVRPIIGEWCDGLIVGSHFGYRNDIFCTADQGKNAGGGSLLHHTNRPNLATKGIRIMTPRELVEHLGL
jgi:hypothetical protein